MGFDFSNEEILFIYGHFLKEIKELETFSGSPNCPISKSTIDKDIALFLSICNKIEKSFPRIKEMQKFI